MRRKEISTDHFTSLSDAQLIAMWQEGEEKAFDVFYIRHVPNLLSLASRKTNSREAARELVQDVFFDLFKQKDSLDAGRNIRAYLYGALRNRIFNYYREVLRKKKHEDFLLLTNNESHNETEQQVACNELKDSLQQGIEGLPSKCREVFVLSRQEHLSHKEIAVRLNISVNTVEQHMRKALQRLRCSIQHYIIWIIVASLTL
ncbi:RNA polymerase sigma factor [Pedobacter sp. SYSU D00535]|uniref:RNA polymerase sigma factor n=1 Tax=Pedobacter sp. SYSU D00535 TaxID=2810308 RepID=UPI001A967A11|nr:RNA polymerase sigma-70 factor [Pedobacter sp. SYSU D00535]